MRFKVYYQKKEVIEKTLKTSSIKHIKLKKIPETHVFLKEVEAENTEEAFQLMQAEQWSPNGEAKNLIRRKKLNHTSFSLGDILFPTGPQEPEDEYFICDTVGWRVLREEKKENRGKTK